MVAVTSLTSAARLPAAAPSTFHGSVKDFGWNPGSGIRMPNQPPAKFGLFVNVTVPVTEAITARTTVNDKTHTITVVLSGKKKSAGAADSRALTTKKLELGVPSGLRLGREYKMIIENDAMHVLKRGKATTAVAM